MSPTSVIHTTVAFKGVGFAHQPSAEGEARSEARKGVSVALAAKKGAKHRSKLYL